MHVQPIEARQGGHGENTKVGSKALLVAWSTGSGHERRLTDRKRLPSSMAEPRNAPVWLFTTLEVFRDHALMAVLVPYRHFNGASVTNEFWTPSTLWPIYING